MPRNFSLFGSSVAVVATADYLPISGESSKPRKPISVSLRRNLLLIIFTAISFLFGVSGVIFALYAVLRPIPTFRCGRVEDTFRPYYSLPNDRSLYNCVNVSSPSKLEVGNLKFLGGHNIEHTVFTKVQTGCTQY